MNKYLLRVFFTTILFVIACKKESNEANITSPESKQSDIEVLEPELLEEGGVNLSVKVNSVPPVEIYSFGIVISRDSLFRNVTYFQEFDLPVQVKTYQYNILSGLEQDSIYYYSYMINRNMLKPQQKNSFKFGKESRIHIDSISPVQAGIGDTLSVFGSFKDYRFTKVTLGDSTMTFNQKSENQLEIFLDGKTPIGSSALTLFTAYQRSVADSEFNLVKPVILSIPPEVSVGEEIIIKGENFSNYKDFNKVYINDVEVPINSFSHNQLKIRIPNNITSTKLNFKVYAQKQSVQANDIIRIRKPKLIKYPKSIRLNQTTSLTFEDLPAVPVEIYVGEQKSYIDFRQDQEGAYNVLWFTPSYGKYTNMSKFSIKYLDETIVFDDEMEISDKWEYIHNNLPFDENSTIANLNVGGSAYVVAVGKDIFSNSNYFLWKFNPTNNTFNKIDIPYNLDNPTVTSFGDRIYIYTGTHIDNFYEYNVIGNKWKKLANYPAMKRNAGVMNSINGNLYMTTGENIIEHFNYQSDPSLYRYNIAKNQWTRLEDYPIDHNPYYGNRVYGESMVIDTEFFVIGGARTTGNYDIFAYNVVNNRWTKKADLEQSMYASTIVKNGYGILLTQYNLKRYDSRANTWQTLSEYLLPSNFGFDNHFTFFALGNYAYAASGGIFFKIKLTNLIP